MSNIGLATEALINSSPEGESLDIEDYTIDELVSILSLSSPTEKNIIDQTNFYINKFEQEGNLEMSTFFKNIQNKLLEELNTDNQEVESNVDENLVESQGYSFLTNDFLEKDNEKPDEKTLQRLQAIGIFDKNHNVMERKNLNTSQQFQVPIAQGKLNPTMKNITTRMVNIDSKYRTNSTPSTKNVKYGSIFSHHTSSWSSSSFVCNLSETLMNVVTLQMYSITIPYSWYLIDETYGNTSFKVNDTEISISEGNYSKTELVSAVSTALENSLGSNNSASYNSINGKSSITLDGSNNTITFYKSGVESNKSCGPGRKANYNLGWILGFRNSVYTDSDAVYDSNNNQYTFNSESFVDVYGPRYLVLIVDDFNANHLNKGLISIEKTQSKFSGPHLKKYTGSNLLPVDNCVDTDSGFARVPQYNQGAPRTVTSAQLYSLNEQNSVGKDTIEDNLIPPTDTDIFAIIPLKKATPGDIITEFTTSIQKNERSYFGPVDIGRINVKLLDDKGNIVNLNGMDWSFIMMVSQLYQY